MSDLAKCECCERTDVLTGINDKFYCVDHLNDGFEGLRSVQDIFDSLNRGAS